MSQLLYLQASPRGDRSRSTQVGDAFVSTYRAAHPEDDIVKFNLFEMDLPPFDGSAMEAKYAILHGGQPSGDQVQAWQAVEAIIAQFTGADRYLLTSPMWNFGIPYRLKQYFDVIVQPGYTFSYSPDTGYEGLVKDKPVLLVHARGGAYADPDMAGYDKEKPYLEQIFGFMGFTDIRNIVIEPTLMAGPDAAQQAVDAALAKARELATTF